MGGRGVGTVTERDRRGEYSVRSEAATLIRLAVPSSLANVTLGISFCVVLMISRYGTDAIAGAGLGLMWVNITAQSLFVGTQFGGGALMAQAFGARNHRRVGLLLQRQLLMNWLLCIHRRGVVLYRRDPTGAGPAAEGVALRRRVRQVAAARPPLPAGVDVRSANACRQCAPDLGCSALRTGA